MSKIIIIVLGVILIAGMVPLGVLYGQETKKVAQAESELVTLEDEAANMEGKTITLEDNISTLDAQLTDSQATASDLETQKGVYCIHSTKQKAMETTASRPDFTFWLPQGLKVNMDVKFPLNNYMNYMNAEVDLEREKLKAQFLKDARQRIMEVTTREYINPEENTVDYALVFIPNEQVYCFINENDRNLIDEALKKKVIVCSPLSLYAILAVIRQAVDNFNLEKTASQILALFGAFNKQWQAFKSSMEKMGRRIDDAKREYDLLVSTRSNQLERPLEQIDRLRIQKGIQEVLQVDEGYMLEESPEESLLTVSEKEEEGSSQML
ncbi:DNA recombination protein RmuC [Chloroflexota bacterium]